MGAKHSKREAPSPSGSVSSKISRTRSLPSKIFKRRISHEYGRIFRGKPLLEDGEVIDEVDEYELLLELEKQSHAKEHLKLHDTRSCIPSLRGSREEIIFEVEDDDRFVVAGEDQQQDTVGSLNGSPLSLSRSSSLSGHCLSEVVDIAPVASVVVAVYDREPEISLIDLPGSPRNSESTHSDLVPAAEFVDNPLQVESLKVDSVSNLEVACILNGESEGNPLIAGDEDRDEGRGSVAFYFTFQAQKKPKTWRRLKRVSRDQEGLPEKMPGKGKVSLSFNTPGKQPRRHSFTDARDFVWDSRDVFGKRMKDDEEDEDAHTDIRPGSFGWGLVGHTNPLLNYDPGFSEDVPDVHYGRNKGWSAKQTSRGTALARKLRGLGGSPKPVTSLESCLRAQMADALTSNRSKGDSLIQNRMNSQMAHALISNRASRPLYFSTVDEDAVFDEDDLVKNTPPSSPSVLENSISVPVPAAPALTALPKLPNLSKFFKEYAVKLSITGGSRSDSPNRRRSRVNDQTSSSPNDSNRLEQPSYETVLFSFGVGLGVLLASGNHEAEVKRLMELLDKTQADLENVTMELARRKSPSRTTRSDPPAGIVRKGQHSVRSYYGSEQQEDQMADLEAELEAELDQLTGGDSATIDSQYSAMDELEMDASVVFGDLEPAGLPAEDEDDSNEDQTPPAQPASLNNYAVSPRELTRLLRKLQTSRQDKLIAELEEDLNTALSKLESRENELEMWKERVKRLMKVSFVSASGDDGIPPRVLIETTVVSTPARNIDVLISQDRVELPIQEHGLPVPGTSLVEDLNSNSSSGPVTQGDLKQKPEGIGRKASIGSSEKDCKPILDNAQIITQLIDSVQGLDFFGDHAESVEMGSTPSLGLLSSSVSLDKTPEKFGGRGLLLPRANPVVPHPSRRTSYNSDTGNPVLIRKPSENENSELRYTESTKSLSDMSEATEIPYSVKYIDSTIKPASALRVAADENSSFWVGRAGKTTPVEKPVRQLFKEQAQSVRPGEVSPTALEKVSRWEGLLEGETPGPATGSDWECQSRASELEQDNVFSEENLVLEAEEMLGRMLIKRIVEKSRLGSESLVKKAQSALATLERDEVDAYHGIEDDFLNESSDSESGRSEDQQQSSFLDEAVRKEYEFFRRLEIINKDRKSLKSAKDKTATETADAGAVAFATIPKAALNVPRLSPASQPLEVTAGSRKDAEVPQSDDVGKENNVKQLVESNSTGRENWLARPDTFRARSGYREDEVRSRRR